MTYYSVCLECVGIARALFTLRRVFLLQCSLLASYPTIVVYDYTINLSKQT